MIQPDIFAADFTPTPYWWEAAPLDDAAGRPPPTRIDIAVVGAGYSGLSAALTAARGGRSVAVLDADRPGEGASTRNGGMCGDFLKPEFAALRRRYGADRARALLLEAREALDFLDSFIGEEGIDCHFVRCGRFTGANKPHDYENLARELEVLRREVGVDGDMIPPGETDSEVGSDLYHGGRLMHRHGGLHPGLFHRGLLDRVRAAGAEVFGETPVTAIARRSDGFVVSTPRGEVTARDVIVASNGYTRPVTRWLRRRVIPVTSYMIATEPLAPELMGRLMPRRRMLTDSNRLLCYYRPSPDGRRILFGGRPAYAPVDLRQSARALHRYMATIFPELAAVRVSHSWTGFIAYTFDRLPHVGVHDGLHYALGYCGSGVVMSTWLGRKAALAVLGAPEAKSAFAGTEFPTMPFYSGRPWFLPVVATSFRLRDLLPV